MAASYKEKPKSKVNIQKNRNKVVCAEPATILKVQDGAEMITKGCSRATIIQTLQDKYHIGYDQAKHIYCESVKFLLPENEDEYRKGLIQANIERLEKIINDCFANGNYKVAREAVDSLNKMLGVGKDGITVGVSTDKVNDTQQVIIKFD